jgi:hypothetical protein
MTWIVWNLVLVHLETVLVSVQDRCTICAKRTIVAEIVFDALDGTPRFEAQVEAHFSLFGDSANLHPRLVHGLGGKYHRLTGLNS